MTQKQTTVFICSNAKQCNRKVIVDYGETVVCCPRCGASMSVHKHCFEVSGFINIAWSDVIRKERSVI